MITVDSLRCAPLFATLPDPELAAIAARAADVRLGTGEWLIQEGEVAAFFVLISGSLAVMKARGGIEHQINAYAPGDFFGELPLLLGSTAVAGINALEPCRVARMEGSDFQELIVGSEALLGAIMRSMTERVGHLQQLGSEASEPEIQVVGARGDLACHDLRDFLARNGIAYQWLDPGDPAAQERVAATGISGERYPVAVLPDGEQLVAPSLRALADAVGLKTTPASDRYDVAIVGGGPAGLAASVYGASEGLKTIMLDRIAPGGQAGTSSRIENYLGFPNGLSGDDLSDRARRQAERFGAELVVARSVTGLDTAPDGGDMHTVRLEDGDEISARAVVLATGVEWRRLGIPGIERFTGRGVFYGAARTEALSMRGKQVHIVGGGNSAGQAAMLFSNYAEQVTILVRGSTLASSMSEYLETQLATKANIAIELNTEVRSCSGEETLGALTLGHGNDPSEWEVTADGLFVFIGAVAETGWLGDEIERDELGFIRTGSQVTRSRWQLERDPMLLETSAAGVFAAGDARSQSIKRVAAGVGEGSMAIAFVHQHLSAADA